MLLTLPEVVEVATALPRQDRAELAQALLATLGTADVPEQTRRAALNAAVEAGVASLDAGQGIRIPEGGLREYLRERGRLATEHAAVNAS
jgi:hypothetical protein